MAERRYVLDTNLFIRGFREEAAREALMTFHRAFAPFEYLSAVVAHELRAGARPGPDARRIERHVLRPFVSRGRLVTPSFRTWERAGDLLARMAREEGLDLGAIPRSFANDLLLAVSCRESGLTLVTGNLRDFERIALREPFSFVPPWPSPRG